MIGARVGVERVGGVRAVSPAALVAELTGRIADEAERITNGTERITSGTERIAGEAEGMADRGGRRWLRVGVDGAPPAGAHQLADALVDPLRVRGRPVYRVTTDDFLRPASVRLEQGRTNPDAFYTDWVDLRGLTREVLAPLADGGTGRILPSLWNAATDRATRAGYVTVAPGGVLLLSGALLLGAGLPLDLVIHLEMSPAALARRIADADRWTLPAYQRYADEVDPALLADVVVRVDDPRHPAVLDGAG